VTTAVEPVVVAVEPVVVAVEPVVVAVEPVTVAVEADPVVAVGPDLPDVAGQAPVLEGGRRWRSRAVFPTPATLPPVRPRLAAFAGYLPVPSLMALSWLS
jgi:hypothetical protein